jgi:hypothetical protein
MTETLEKMLNSVPNGQIKSIELYTGGVSHLYTGPMGLPPINPSPFFPTSTGFGISLPRPLDFIKDYHETFKIDRYGNLYGGHSSITVDDQKKRVDHNE